jgi:single-strand DNA-binding protein
MSGSVNKVILIGRLGADPEVKYTQSGDPVANFSLATDESWKNERGEKQGKTEWHKIVAWRKVAELAKQYLGKGKQIYLEGKLQTRSWEDKDGNKRWTTEIVAASIQFLGSKGDGGGDRQAEQRQAEPAPAQGQAFGQDDDIPF